MTPPVRKKKGGFEIGVNLRVTQCFDKGGRNYMEDYSKYYFEKDPTNNQSVVFAFFGVFDGHGGTEAAELANQSLLDEIKSQEEFWSQDDNDVLQAIRQGFLKTHEKMVEAREKWPLTPSGFQSTAGTTASIAIIRNRKLYVGHVGDSAVVIGCCSSDSKDSSTDNWGGTALTIEHKPDHPEERRRIEAHGGSVRRKAGIHRVVWNRPKTNKVVTATASTSPVQMSAEYEEIPFLAVARSLGDLWSFDPETGEFHVSPEPDISVYELRPTEHRCLIIGSDGLWNVIKPETAVELVRLCERETESRVFADPTVSPTFFYHPAGTLVQYALERCLQRNVRADNVTALVVMIDPPGKPMTQLRLERRRLLFARLSLEDRSNGNYREPTASVANDVGSIRRLLVESQRALGRDASSSPTNTGNGDTKAITHHRTSDNTADVQLPPENNTTDINSTPAKSSTQSSKTRALPPLCVLRETLQGPSGFPTLVEAWSEPCWRDMLAYCKQTGLTNATSGEMDAKRLLDHLMDMDAKYRKEALQAVPTVLSMKRAFIRDHEMSVCLSQIPLLSREWTQLVVMSSSNPSSPTSTSPGHVTTPTSPLGPPSPSAYRRWLERRDKILNHLYQMLGRKLPSELSKDAQDCMKEHVAREVSQRMRISRPCDENKKTTGKESSPSSPSSKKTRQTSTTSDLRRSESHVDKNANTPIEEEPFTVKKEPTSVVNRTRRQRRLTSNGPESPTRSSTSPVRKPVLRRVVAGENATTPDRLVLPVDSVPTSSPSRKLSGGSKSTSPIAKTNGPTTNHVPLSSDSSITSVSKSTDDTVSPAIPVLNQPNINHLNKGAPETRTVVPWRRRSTTTFYTEEKARVENLMEKLVVVVTPGPQELAKVVGKQQKTSVDQGPPKPRPVLLPASSRSTILQKRKRKSDSDAPKIDPCKSKAAVVLPVDKSSYKGYFKKVIVDATAEARLEEVMRSVTYKTAQLEVKPQQDSQTNDKAPAASESTQEQTPASTDPKSDSNLVEVDDPKEAKRRRVVVGKGENSLMTTSGRRSLRLRSNKSD